MALDGACNLAENVLQIEKVHRGLYVKVLSMAANR